MCLHHQELIVGVGRCQTGHHVLRGYQGFLPLQKVSLSQRLWGLAHVNHIIVFVLFFTNKVTQFITCLQMNNLPSILYHRVIKSLRFATVTTSYQRLSDVTVTFSQLTLTQTTKLLDNVLSAIDSRTVYVPTLTCASYGVM